MMILFDKDHLINMFQKLTFRFQDYHGIFLLFQFNVVFYHELLRLVIEMRFKRHYDSFFYLHYLLLIFILDYCLQFEKVKGLL